MEPFSADTEHLHLGVTHHQRFLLHTGPWVRAHSFHLGLHPLHPHLLEGGCEGLVPPRRCVCVCVQKQSGGKRSAAPITALSARRKSHKPSPAATCSRTLPSLLLLSGCGPTFQKALPGPWIQELVVPPVCLSRLHGNCLTQVSKASVLPTIVNP